jgi:hypothetical protein
MVKDTANLLWILKTTTPDIGITWEDVSHLTRYSLVIGRAVNTVSTKPENNRIGIPPYTE